MEAAAYDYFARIDELGGMVAAIESNFPQREISDAAFEHQAALERGERIMVGVNAFEVDDDELTEIHRPDPAAETRQKERLAAHPGGPRRQRRGGRARGARARRRRRRQPDAAADRLRPRPGQRGGDGPGHAERLRHLHRDTGLLTLRIRSRDQRVGFSAMRRET